MITRPLDLASKLRQPPRSLDHVFFINAGLIVLFFSIFGSRFVVSPGVEVSGPSPMLIPATETARRGAVAPTHTLKLFSNGLMIDTHGAVKSDEIDGWLRTAFENTQPQTPVLSILADRKVPSGDVIDLVGKAQNAGFVVHWAANAIEPPRK